MIFSYMLYASTNNVYISPCMESYIAPPESRLYTALNLGKRYRFIDFSASPISESSNPRHNIIPHSEMNIG
jgi:hypothetical protein